MPEIPCSMRKRYRPLGRGIGLLLALTLLGACGASDSAEDQIPAISSRGEEAAEPQSQERRPPPGEGWVIFGIDTVKVELARTPAEREQGLMYRENLPPGRGMLFIFQDSQYRSFWMRNTYIPLDIAYLDESLRIVDIQAMEPQSEEGHPSARPAMFALEVPQGWFAGREIGVGDQATLVLGPGG